MPNKLRSEIVATCDICNKGITKQENFYLMNDLIICSKCDEEMGRDDRYEFKFQVNKNS